MKTKQSPTYDTTCRKPKSKGKTKGKSTDHEVQNNKAPIILPYDIIEIIISKLPFKSVLRFKTVSKSWNAMLSTQRFARMHLDQIKILSKRHYSDDTTTHSDHLFFIWHSHDPNVNFVRGDRDDSAKIYQRAEFNNNQMKFRLIKSPNNEADYYNNLQGQQVLCTCDGFLLLLSTNFTGYVLWNPTTKAYTFFSSIPHLVNPMMTTYGMCYDSSNDDYKVILVTRKYYVVYSYKSDTWTERKEFPYSGISKDPGIFINGVLYWVATTNTDKNSTARERRYGRFLSFNELPSPNTTKISGPIYEFDRACNHEIIYFDPTNNEFNKFHMPRDDHGTIKETDTWDPLFKELYIPHGLEVVYLTTLKGCLCLYQNSFDRTMIRLWILEDGYLWRKFLDIKDLPVNAWTLTRPHLVKPLCLTNNDEIVLQVRNDTTNAYPQSKFLVCSYTKKKKKYKYSKFRKFCIGDHSHAITCLYSMITLPARTLKSDTNLVDSPVAKRLINMLAVYFI